MGLMSTALRALGLTSADGSTADGRDAALLVDGALARGGALWTRARTLVRASGAVATAFYELSIDPTNGGLNVNLAGGAVGGSTVAQGDPNADATKGWPVRIFNAAGQLLGRLAAASSLPVVLSTEDKAYLASPGAHYAITPSDSTDLTTAGAGGGPAASIGLLCTVSGTLAIRGTTTTSTTVSYPVVAGQYIWGSFSRVMGATNASVVGLAP